jgi:hypothetical protein
MQVLTKLNIFDLSFHDKKTSFTYDTVHLNYLRGKKMTRDHSSRHFLLWLQDIKRSKKMGKFIYVRNLVCYLYALLLNMS